MKDLLQLDKLDLEFIMEVQNHLKPFFGERSSEILLSSSFLDRLKEDPEYVYHYDEHYWAEIIRKEYNSKQLLSL